jgi:hypothetical protein
VRHSNRHPGLFFSGCGVISSPLYENREGVVILTAYCYLEAGDDIRLSEKEYIVYIVGVSILLRFGYDEKSQRCVTVRKAFVLRFENTISG